MPLHVIANVVIVIYVAAALALRRRRKYLTALTYIFLAWAVCYFAVAASRAVRSHGDDFAQYLIGSAELLAGRDPYADYHYYERTGAGPIQELNERRGLPPTPPISYPPPFYLLVAPLLLFPYETAFVVWTAASVVMLVAAVALVYHAMGLSGHAGLAAALALTLVAHPTIDHIYYGQANILLALAWAGVLWALVRRRAAAAGLLATAATIFKIYPGILFVYFLLRRRGRELAVALGSFAAAVILIALAWRPAIWSNYVRLVLVPVLTAGIMLPVNVAPATILPRLAPVTAAMPPLVVITKLLSVLLFVLLIVYLRRERLDVEGEVSLLVAAGLALNAWVSPSYLIVLIIPYIYVTREIFRGRARAVVGVLATFSFVIIMLRYNLKQFQVWPATMLGAVKPLGLVMLVAALLFHTPGRKTKDTKAE